MQLKTIKQIKGELKRLRRCQNIHQKDERINRKMNRLRTKLWKLLKKQPHTKKSTRSQKRKEIGEEETIRRKSKGASQYI